MAEVPPSRMGAGAAAGPATAGPAAGGRAAASVGDDAKRTRELCLWLGGLATWRAGLVGALVKRHGSFEAVMACGAQRLRRDALERPARAAADAPGDEAAEGAKLREWLALEPAAAARRLEQDAPGIVLAWSDEAYPPLLRQLHDPPPCIFVTAACGRARLLERLRELCARPSVAVVGTRGPSSYGDEMAAMLGHDLAALGAVVVSGMALGIDAAAQEAAVRAGAPGLGTVAVLGCGADVLYPRANAGLRRLIAGRGLIVSEFVWGTRARPWRFPSRNRLMAALARAVVVVEGAERSGARLTAGFAVELDREVLAVPGEAGRKLAQAPHALLREGAFLCESAADALEAATRALLPPPAAVAGPVPEEKVARLLEPLPAASDAGQAAGLLRRTPRTVEALATASGWPRHRVAAALCELELLGVAESTPSGRYRLRRPAAPRQSEAASGRSGARGR